MTDLFLKRFIFAFMFLLLGGFILLSLGACVMVDSHVALRPSASIAVNGYNRGGVNDTAAQQDSTNGVQEVWTDSKGGGELAADVVIDPNLPAVE